LKEKIEIFQGDITELKVEAIVNAANTSLLGGGGVDGAIHRAAGHELLEYCRKLDGCPTGQAKITPGFKLHAKFIIHTAGPIWRGGDKNEDTLLASCYKNSLQLALENKIKTLAFPAISTGIYNFPLQKAAKIAIKETSNFLKINTSIEKIIFVCYNNENFNIYKKEIENLTSI
jgi:O-acetyl-ADP-ribose deacetylase (regulator of RNase III)